MNETQLITYVIEKACSTQKLVQGALVAFFCDLKEALIQYLEGHIEGVDKPKERFEESIARYQAMQEEAEQELEKIRRANH